VAINDKEMTMSTTQIQSSTKLGATGPEVFPVALGCMAMSGIYGKTSDDENIATIQEAIDRGINVIDTSDFYSLGHNEVLNPV
jgi:aryl-alcohol dehydrogenase-like predicted oxidoreductase